MSANRQQVAATDRKGGGGRVVAHGVDSQDNNIMKQHKTGCKQHMERERERERERDRQRERQRERDRDRETERDRERQRQRERDKQE